jgi:hypothetical protein
MAVITSAGCNVLDYAIAGPREIVAVDANPQQNALLELKVAAIRALDFDEFFALFGAGRPWHLPRQRPAVQGQECLPEGSALLRHRQVAAF